MAMTTAETDTYKILIVGNDRVGKSTYINRLMTGDFISDWNPTICTCIHSYAYRPFDRLLCNFNLWDMKLSSGFAHQCSEADGMIVMFDLQEALSFYNVKCWINDVKLINPEIPIVIVGTKSDLKIGENKVNSLQICNMLLKNYSRDIIQSRLVYYEMSSKSNYNFYAPIKWLYTKIEPRFNGDASNFNVNVNIIVPNLDVISTTMEKIKTDETGTEIHKEVVSKEDQLKEPLTSATQVSSRSRWNYIKPWKWFR